MYYHGTYRTTISERMQVYFDTVEEQAGQGGVLLRGASSLVAPEGLLTMFLPGIIPQSLTGYVKPDASQDIRKG